MPAIDSDGTLRYEDSRGQALPGTGAEGKRLPWGTGSPGRVGRGSYLHGSSASLLTFRVCV